MKTTDDEVQDKSFVEIDKFALDVEWQEQPVRVRDVCFLLADMKAQMLKAKAALDLVEADLRLEITRDPTAFDLPKTTEAIIDAAIITQERYQKALAKLNRLKHKIDLLSGVLEALQHRKKALEDLVVLHTAAYFAEPSARKEDKERLGEMTKRNIKGVKKR